MEHKSITGFTLIELLVSLVIFTLLSATAIPISLHLIDYQNLDETTNVLVERMRYSQSLAEICGSATVVRLAPFAPSYQLWQGTNITNFFSFAPDVNYKDGYLQMETGRITYDMMGGSEVSGVVRLMADHSERDIELYMGSGLQVNLGVLK